MTPTDSTRRRLLAGLAGGLCLAATPGATLARGDRRRRLTLYNAHTGEDLDLVYWQNGYYRPEALAQLNHVLRDFRTGDVHPIDRGLLDALARLDGELGFGDPWRVISGYRSPRTNAKLRARSSGVARRSLHMRGMAVDFSAPGVGLADLREAARGLRVGGVGYYPRSGFIHMDTGRVRYW